MKNLGNFLVGTLSSFGVAQSLPGAADLGSLNTVDLFSSIEAIISLLSGVLSAALVAWLRRKWDKNKRV